MTVNTIVADLSGQPHHGNSNRGATNYGKLGATFGGCFLVGPAIGGMLEDMLYPTASFHAATVLVLSSIAWVYFFVPETRSVMNTRAYLDSTAPTVVLSTGETQSANLLSAVRSAKINPLPRIREIFTSDALKWLAAGVAVSSLAQGGLNSIFFLYLNTRLGWGSAVRFSFTTVSLASAAL